MLLSNEERKRFCEWLEKDIESNKMLVAQMEKMKILEVLVKQKKQMIAAEMIVLHELKNIELITLEQS